MDLVCKGPTSLYKKQPCEFDVLLSEEARRSFKIWLERHPGIEADVQADGTVYLLRDCLQEKKEIQFGKMIDAHLFQHCAPQVQNYGLSSQVFWMKEDDADRLGFNPWGILGNNLLDRQRHELYSYIAKEKRSLSGSPNLQVSLGREAWIRHGFDLLLPPSREGRGRLLKVVLN